MQQENPHSIPQQNGKALVTFRDLIQFATLIVMIIALVLRLKED